MTGLTALSAKGQSSIEYLMNYAWAIALIIIVGVAIFTLNIGDIQTSLSAQSSEVSQAAEQVSVVGYRCDEAGSVNITLRNNGADTAKSVALNVSNATHFVATSCLGDTDLFHGDTVTCSNIESNTTDKLAFQANNTHCGEIGDEYTIQVNFSYVDDRSDLTYTPVRNFTGTVES